MLYEFLWQLAAQELEAVDFMSGLDKRRFAQFIVDIENNVIAGIRTIPDTLAKIYSSIRIQGGQHNWSNSSRVCSYRYD